MLSYSCERRTGVWERGRTAQLILKPGIGGEWSQSISAHLTFRSMSSVPNSKEAESQSQPPWTSWRRNTFLVPTGNWRL